MAEDLPKGSCGFFSRDSRLRNADLAADARLCIGGSSVNFEGGEETRAMATNDVETNADADGSSAPPPPPLLHPPKKKPKNKKKHHRAAEFE